MGSADYHRLDADNDGWELLRQVAAEVGEKNLEKQCRKAFEEEQEHLEKVRGWLLDMTIEAAGAADDADVGEEQPIEEDRPRKKTSHKKTSSSKRSKRKKK